MDDQKRKALETALTTLLLNGQDRDTVTAFFEQHEVLDEVVAGFEQDEFRVYADWKCHGIEARFKVRVILEEVASTSSDAPAPPVVPGEHAAIWQ